MIGFVIVVACKDEGLVKAQEIIEGLPTFGDLDGNFSRLIGHEQGLYDASGQRMESDILAYEFCMAEDDFLYLRHQIEETILNGCVSYFQRDIFYNLHQLA